MKTTENSARRSPRRASTSSALYLLLALMACAFYMICASSPLRWDDMIYEYVWLDHRPAGLLHPIDLNNRVDNVGEAFVSGCHHYLVMNGRFVVHFITQCFNGFIGKGLFNVVNAWVYALFLILSIRFCCHHTKKSSLFTLHSSLFTLHSSLFIIAGLWLLLPVQWILSFDVVFAINYLWTATICLGFLLLFRRMSESGTSAVWKNALLFLFALLCGNFHEGYSLLLSGALFFYALTHFRRLNGSQWCLIAGMWVGTLTVIGSPGIWGRASGAQADTLQETLVRKLDILRYSKRLYLLLFALAAAYFLMGKEQLKAFLKENQIALMVVPLGFLFLFMLPYYSQRMGFPMELFSVLLLLKLLLQSPARRLLGRPVSMAIAVLLVVHVSLTVYYAQKVGDEYQAMLQEYKQSPTGTAHQQAFVVPKPFRPYILRLGDPAELGIISFIYHKEMHIVNENHTEK